MKIDMHCHVKEGSLDSKVGIKDFIQSLIEQGFDGMLITDHNTYNGYRYWRDHIKGKAFKDFVVLKGIEYDTLDGGHMIVVMPPGVKLQSLELRGMNTEDLIDLVNRHGGIVGPAHPGGEKYMSFCNTKCYKYNPNITSRFHFIETYNACEPVSANDMAKDLAQKYNKVGVGGSDAHKEVCVGWGYVEFPQPIKDEFDLIKQIRQKVTTQCGGLIYDQTTKDKMGKLKVLWAYSFLVYNMAGAVGRQRIRKLKLKLENPIDPIDPIESIYRGKRK